MIPCFIISFNRPTFLKRQLEYLLPNRDLQVIIVDNNSTYEPLLDYYKTLNCIIHYCPENYGHQVVWSEGLSRAYAGDSHYIVTDCDVIPDHVKSDYLEVMQDGVEHPNYNKVGLGLNTNHIPYNFKDRDKVINHENKVLFRKEIGNPVFYQCPVDTTFAMYKGGYHEYSVWGTSSNHWNKECKSLRMKKPYEATHLGWHITELSEEDKNYFKTSLKTTGHWKQ